MSAANLSGLAASFAQTTIQQGQTARMQDARRSEGARQARRMRELLQRELDSVGDSYEVSDESLFVDEDGSGGSQAGGGLPRRRAERREPKEAPGGSHPPFSSDGERHQIDLTA